MALHPGWAGCCLCWDELTWTRRWVSSVLGFAARTSGQPVWVAGSLHLQYPPYTYSNITGVRAGCFCWTWPQRAPGQMQHSAIVQNLLYKGTWLKMNGRVHCICLLAFFLLCNIFSRLIHFFHFFFFLTTLSSVSLSVC